MQFELNIEDNKAIARKFLSLVSEGDVEEMCNLIDNKWIMHIGLGAAAIPAGEEGLRVLFKSFGEIEQKWTINDIIAEDDKVVVRATNRCSQESFLGIPSYGLSQTFTATFTHRIVDGRIKETWRNADDLGRILQLGAKIIPPAA